MSKIEKDLENLKEMLDNLINVINYRNSKPYDRKKIKKKSFYYTKSIKLKKFGSCTGLSVLSFSFEKVSPAIFFS